MNGPIGPSSVPAWAQVVAVMLVGDGTDTPFDGVLRLRSRRRDPDTGAVTEPWTSERRVWVDGGRSRVEVVGGPTTIRHPDAMWVVRPDDPGVAEVVDLELSAVVSDDDVLLRRPLGRSWVDLDDLGRLVSGPRQDEVHGRRAWKVRLERDDPWPSRVTWWVDAERGLVLRETGEDGLVTAEWLELTIGEPAPDGTFTWDGPTRSVPVEGEPSAADLAHAAEQRKVEQLGLTGLRVPFSGEVSVHESKRNGAFEVELMSQGFAMLSRRPAGSPRRRGWTTQHVHRWSDDRWDWTLAVDAPLSDAELDAVRARLPD